MQVEPEPIEYPIFWINDLPEQVKCGTLIPITGHVPYEGGLLMSYVYSWTLDKNGIKWLDYRQVANHSYQTEYELQNYLIIPCRDVYGIYDVSFVYTAEPEIHRYIGLHSLTITHSYHFEVEIIE